MWEFIHAGGPRPRFHPSQSPGWHSYGSREAEPLSWRAAYEKKTNVLRRALRLELLFSLLWFIGSIVTSFLPVLNVPLICSSRACTWNNSLKMNEEKAKHRGAVRWEGAVDRKRKKTRVRTQVKIGWLSYSKWCFRVHRSWIRTVWGKRMPDLDSFILKLDVFHFQILPLYFNSDSIRKALHVYCFKTISMLCWFIAILVFFLKE